ncbi:MAG: hypothetical protein KBA26_04360 [Candidatus Delongbacteria bacterium]|nr:hypothetical protein [Candidatus Delongbacteria bacterium]
MTTSSVCRTIHAGSQFILRMVADSVLIRTYRRLPVWILQCYHQSEFKVGYHRLMRFLLRNLILVRRNSVRSWGIILLIRIAVLIRRGYLLFTHPEVKQNSWLMRAADDLQESLPILSLRWIGIWIMALTVVNSGLILAFRTELIWVDAFYRIIWLTISLVLMVCPESFNRIKSSSIVWRRWSSAINSVNSSNPDRNA